ncbi:hypothetical protein IE077_000668, partial [Cardiosporidium cionae]
STDHLQLAHTVLTALSPHLPFLKPGYVAMLLASSFIYEIETLECIICMTSLQECCGYLQPETVDFWEELLSVTMRQCIAFDGIQMGYIFWAILNQEEEMFTNLNCQQYIQQTLAFLNANPLVENQLTADGIVHAFYCLKRCSKELILQNQDFSMRCFVALEGLLENLTTEQLTHLLPTMASLEATLSMIKQAFIDLQAYDVYEAAQQDS